ncbi:HD domain-containing phosphohydrolase [Psychromonas arctica]|uniref:HD domain-containing phosphohydrolase n=1 Tax=Psychromonas arctica TaxID=168275 RepID=UPI002FD1BDEC
MNKQRHVVIVDDQSTGRMILQKVILQIANDIKVIDFADPHDALQWLSKNPADLIVTDYRMPGLNGIEFIQEVRKLNHGEHVPIMMITVVSEKAIRYEALDAGVTAFLTRPIDQIECRTTCRNLLKLHQQHVIIQNRADWLAEQVELATKQILQREKETILKLAKAGEYRDEETGNHVIRMAKYSKEIACEMGLTETECSDLEHAAQMHDIGKIGIPDKILLKPGKFEADEWVIMQTHATIGFEILSGSESKYMQMGAIVALNHHERFDGTGYPNKLAGKDIPLIARIVSVADVFDALISVRPYKKAWPIQDAIDFINSGSGTHFDPQCIEAFNTRLPVILQIQKQYPDS